MVKNDWDLQQGGAQTGIEKSSGHVVCAPFFTDSFQKAGRFLSFQIDSLWQIVLELSVWK